MNRTIEFILGFIGGISGSLIGIFLLLTGTINAITDTNNRTFEFGIVITIVSLVTIVTSTFVSTKTKVSGVIMIICTIIGLCCSTLYILSALLIVISGTMCLLRKRSI